MDNQSQDYTTYGFDAYGRKPMSQMTYTIPASNVANVIESIPNSMITGGFIDGTYTIGGPVTGGGQNGMISITNGTITNIISAS
jgi:hypothetical protein